jgi:hypothetical protein
MSFVCRCKKKKKIQKLSYVKESIFYNFSRNKFMFHIIQNISGG